MTYQSHRGGLRRRTLAVATAVLLGAGSLLSGSGSDVEPDIPVPCPASSAWVGTERSMFLDLGLRSLTEHVEQVLHEDPYRKAALHRSEQDYVDVRILDPDQTLDRDTVCRYRDILARDLGVRVEIIIVLEDNGNRV